MAWSTCRLKTKTSPISLGSSVLLGKSVMAKVKTAFRCQECGYSTARWLGRCPECQQWNSFVEEQEAAPARLGGGMRSRSMTAFSSEVVTLADVQVAPLVRTPTGVAEFDRVLGGGVVPGSMVLLGGPPGIGKS